MVTSFATQLDCVWAQVFYKRIAEFLIAHRKRECFSRRWNPQRVRDYASPTNRQQWDSQSNLRISDATSWFATEADCPLVPQTLTAWFYHALWPVQLKLCLLQSLSSPLPISLFLSKSRHIGAPTNNNINSPEYVSMSLLRFEETCALLARQTNKPRSSNYCNFSSGEQTLTNQDVLPKPSSVILFYYSTIEFTFFNLTYGKTWQLYTLP